MNKSEIIAEISLVMETPNQAQAAVDSLLSGITAALARGEAVSLTGFGTFKPVRQKARKARNPRTGEEIQIAERIVPKFIPGKHLKSAV